MPRLHLLRPLRFVAITVLLAWLTPLSASAAEQQALIIHLRVAASFSKTDLEALFKLEQDVALAIERAHAGEQDGNEVGGGEFTIYCYGPNADRLFAVVAPVLRRSPYSSGGRVILRYGRPGARQTERRLWAE